MGVLSHIGRERLRGSPALVGSYVCLGFCLPWIVVVFTAIRYNRFDELAAFPSHLFEAGYNYALVSCLNVIPFAVVAASAIVHSKMRGRDTPRLAALWVGAAVVFIVSAVYQTLAWSNLIGPHPDALTGIAFMVLPVIGTIAFVVSGFLTWLVVTVSLRARPR